MWEIYLLIMAEFFKREKIKKIKKKTERFTFPDSTRFHQTKCLIRDRKRVEDCREES